MFISLSFRTGNRPYISRQQPILGRMSHIKDRNVAHEEVNGRAALEREHAALEHNGCYRARIYADTLSAALVALTAGPTTVGARERSEIGKGIFTLHVAQVGHKGRHFVLCRVGRDKRQRHIEVLRLLHDAMDLKLHTLGT
jgi:toxin ParE1/3/4